MLKYIPEWVDGKDVGVGRRDAAGRYRAIAGYLRDNPIGETGTGFTVFELGAYNGYVSRRLADDFGAICTAVDDYPGLKAYPGVSAVNRRIPAAQIAPSSYDVAIALSVLHHMPDWRDYLEALIDAGTVVFLEVAHPKEVLPKAKAHQHSTAINRAVKAKKLGGRVIAETPGFDAEYLRPLIVIDHRRHDAA